MKNDIRLFINNKEIEFSSDPKILLNYKETELHNPTIVRNSFSKQVTIEGTNRNNDVFGHIWDLTRIQEGSYFNPIKKTDFQLFVNDELFEKGYCKLDKVTRTNNTTQYSITLYGGLGSFLYNLTYDQDDNSNAKKTLASLKYSEVGGAEPDFEFTIDKNSVYEAWGQIAGFGTVTNDRWNVVNFVPALNGIPDDFDANKVLINNYNLNSGGASGFYKAKEVSGTTYTAVLNGVLNQNGYSLGEASEDLTEWQTRDLRSYNQRPALSMYRIIKACCNPENNGGYEVKLDEHFFHTNNPYYRDSWVTMPLLKNIEGIGGGETVTVTGATISTASSSYYGEYMYPVNFNTSSLSSINNVKMSVSVRFNPTGTTSVTNLYPYHTFNTTNSSGRHVKEFENNQGVIIQLFAIGEAGEIVGQSKAYLLGGQKNWHAKDKDPMWDKYWSDYTNKYGTEPEYEFVPGYFKKISGAYQFVNEAGQKTNINFTFDTPSNFATMLLKVVCPLGKRVKYASIFEGGTTWEYSHENHPSLYTTKNYNTTGNYTLLQAELEGRIGGDFRFVVDEFEGTGIDYESFFSGTKITKEKLLCTKHTPADYLLSYCKMFGLYFYHDSTEESSNPSLYPAGVVHIMDRDTFYTEEIVDLSKLIDWNKNLEITPALADTKWYKFDTDHIDGELDKDYKAQYGQDYGAQLVNTNYNFNADTTDLYDGNVFKSAIMALEKDKYFKKTPTGLPVYQYNGLTYNLFNRETSTSDFNTTEIEFPVQTTSKMQSINADYEYFDGFPKLQLHGEKNEPTDGEDVLVFFQSSIQTTTNYWLTDDIVDMAILNDGRPCWILTNSEYDAGGNRIARSLNSLPSFTRDLILFGRSYGNIVHSWNFGHPQVIYSPDTYTTDGDAIYDVCWRDYIRDLYNVDTRKLTCYVRAIMKEKPYPYWLRRYYWFENSLWRLNEIKDLNIGSFDTTKMEFIKVQDMEDYKLDRIEYQGKNGIILNKTVADCVGDTIRGTIILQAGGGWYAGDYLVGEDTLGNTTYLDIGQVMSPTRGRGQVTTPFTIYVPGNTGNTPITWTVSFEDDFDNWYRASFVQGSCNTGSVLTITPSAQTVSPESGLAEYTITYQNVSNIGITAPGDWFSTAYAEGRLMLIYSANTASSATQRTALITVSGTGLEGPIMANASLTQRAPGNIYVDKPVIYFDYGTGTQHTKEVNVSIITDDNWTSNIQDN